MIFGSLKVEYVPILLRCLLSDLQFIIMPVAQSKLFICSLVIQDNKLITISLGKSYTHTAHTKKTLSHTYHKTDT